MRSRSNCQFKRRETASADAAPRRGTLRPPKQSRRLISSDKHRHSVSSPGQDYSNREFLEFLHRTKRKDLERRGKRALMMGLAALTQIQAAGRGVDNRRCFVFILGATWE